MRRDRTLGLLTTTATLLASGCGVRVVSPRPPAATGTAGGTAGMEEAVPRIDVDAAYAEVQQGRSVLIDVRSAASYGAQHARGALHVPVEDVEVNPKAALGGLPAAKRLITYCT